MLEEASTTSTQSASASSASSFYNKHWFNDKIGAMVLNYFLNSKTLLFRHNVAVKNGGKATCEYRSNKARRASALEMTKFFMKNEDIASNEKICNANMDHFGERINRPAQLLKDMLVALCGANSE